MATTTVEQELVELENKYWQAMRDKNVEAALALTDDPCIVAGGKGPAQVDHATYRKLLAGANWELKSFEISQVVARQLADDTAAIAYKVTEQMIVDGKPLTLEAFDTSTWVRRGGRWLCSVHTETIAGDPFGRDKKKDGAGG